MPRPTRSRTRSPTSSSSSASAWGAPSTTARGLPVSAVTELELYFQTQSLLRKANQLAQELAAPRRARRARCRPARSTPGDVYALLEDALAQIRVAAEAIGITERATFEQRVTSIAATGVFLVVIDINRQLNQMLRVPISDAEVFEEVSAAITYAAALLATYPGTTPVPRAAAVRRLQAARRRLPAPHGVHGRRDPRGAEDRRARARA